MQIRSTSSPAPRSYNAAPLLAVTVGWAPGRSRMTSSQRTGRPVANRTGMPADCAAATASAFCSLTEPSGERKVPSRSETMSFGTPRPSTSSGRMAEHMGYNREPGVDGGAADAVPVSVGWPPPDVSVPDGDGDPEPDSVPEGDGEPDPDSDPDGDGDP